MKAEYSPRSDLVHTGKLVLLEHWLSRHQDLHREPEMRRCCLALPQPQLHQKHDGIRLAGRHAGGIGCFRQRANFVDELEAEAIDAAFRLRIIVPAVMQQLAGEGANRIDQRAGAVRVEAIPKAREKFVVIDQHVGGMDPSHIK